jgi:hypothetical protein
MMIESPTPVAAAETPVSPGGNRRRWWTAGLIVVSLLAVAGLLLPSGPAPVSAPAPITSSAPAVALAPLPSPSAGGTAASVPRDLLGLPGRVPTRGTGTFKVAPGRGKVLGTKGPLRRFRVAVEKGSNEDPADFAAQVEATLGDKRSWIGNGQVRLQRVSGERPSFTVYLVTRDTAGRMCRIGGVNITVLGRPYTSCRATGRVIINLDRWRLSARPYRAAKVPLTVYRQYVINHETGHELGYSHEGCPKRGGPAPVMVQQTLTVRGCVPYAWPRRNNRRFTGPSL